MRESRNFYVSKRRGAEIQPPLNVPNFCLWSQQDLKEKSPEILLVLTVWTLVEIWWVPKPEMVTSVEHSSIRWPVNPWTQWRAAHLCCCLEHICQFFKFSPINNWFTTSWVQRFLLFTVLTNIVTYIWTPSLNFDLLSALAKHDLRSERWVVFWNDQTKRSKIRAGLKVVTIWL